jgi:hypothetical protein
MKPSSFDPQWYELKREELAKLADELKRDPRMTWNHPADWLMVGLFLVSLLFTLLGVFG